MIVMVVIMVMVMVVIMVIVMVVIVIMVMVVMMIVVLIMIVTMHVGSRDSCPDSRQAGRVVRMVGAVALCRGRSREERDCAEASYRGSSKNESVTGHGCSLRESSAATSLVKHCSRRLNVGRVVAL
jgi:hypothetical protein